MSRTSTTLIAIASLLGLVNCQPSVGQVGIDENGKVPELDLDNIPDCPVDPDCAIAGTCDEYVCPDYWVCESIGNGRKRCVTPGPSYPGDGEWECKDEGGATVCTGSEYPDGGGANGFDCVSRDEFAVCTKNNPEYPDGGATGVTDCWFEREFRICQTPASGNGAGGSWTCVDENGGKVCRQANPRFPDDRDWECYDRARDGKVVTVCRAPGGFPVGDSAEPWDCELRDEFVECVLDNPDLPPGDRTGGPNGGGSNGGGGNNSGGGDGSNGGGDGSNGGDGSSSGGGGTNPYGGDGNSTPWICVYVDEGKECREPNGSNTPNPGEVCVPGTQRWCDDRVYCSWGKQDCLPDGSWGRCVEPAVLGDAVQDRPDNFCACSQLYFDDDCCEDQADRDRDGKPDCLIPDDHQPPNCEDYTGPRDGTACSACDFATNCGGALDICVHSSVGSFCGTDCSAGQSCPSGFECRGVECNPRIDSGCMAGVSYEQCVPVNRSCF